MPVRTNSPQTCLCCRWRRNQAGWLYKMYLYVDFTAQHCIDFKRGVLPCGKQEAVLCLLKMLQAAGSSWPHFWSECSGFLQTVLKECYGTRSYLRNLRLYRISVWKTRLSPRSQAVQFTAIAAVILSHSDSLWMLGDLQTLPEIINTLCLPSTYYKW